MLNNPLKAYRTVENATLEGRELEASLLNRSAARLSAVKNHWEDSNREAALDEALRYNQKLWTVFQADLMQEDNAMPAEIKRNLLTLSFFIDKRTFDLMSFPEPEKLNILIDINRNIAAGLSNAASADMPGR